MNTSPFHQDYLGRPEEGTSLFTLEDEPIALVIFSEGYMYSVEADLCMVSYVLNNPKFLFDSNIPDVMEDVMSGASLIYDHTHQNQDQDRVTPSSPSFSNIPFDQLMNAKRCSRCDLSLIDFLQQTRRGCSYCCREFKNELMHYFAMMDAYAAPHDYPTPSPPVGGGFFGSSQPYPVFQQHNMPYPSAVEDYYDDDDGIDDEIEDIEDIDEGGESHIKPMGGSGMTRANRQIDVSSVHEMVKEKEKSFRNRKKTSEEGAKLNYSKFVSLDKEFLINQIEKNDARINKLLLKGNFEVAEIYKTHNEKLKKRLEEDDGDGSNGRKK